MPIIPRQHKKVSRPIHVKMGENSTIVSARNRINSSVSQTFRSIAGRSGETQGARLVRGSCRDAVGVK
jgi:hypothetical protein